MAKGGSVPRWPQGARIWPSFPAMSQKRATRPGLLNLASSSSGLEFSRLEFSGLDLKGLEFSGLEVSGFEVIGCEFRNSISTESSSANWISGSNFKSSEIEK